MFLAVLVVLVSFGFRSLEGRLEGTLVFFSAFVFLLVLNFGALCPCIDVLVSMLRL